MQDDSEEQVNEPSDRFLQLPQVKFGSEKNSEVGSEENQTAFFDNSASPGKKKSTPSGSAKIKKKGGIGKFIRTGKPPRSPQESTKKKLLSPILVTNQSGQSSSVHSRTSLTPKQNLVQNLYEESKTQKKKGRIFKKNGS